MNPNAANPREALAAKEEHNRYVDWLDESGDLPERGAYSGITGATRDEIKADPKHEVPLLPDGYSATARLTADQQAALAGFRIAEKIRDVLR